MGERLELKMIILALWFLLLFSQICNILLCWTSNLKRSINFLYGWWRNWGYELHRSCFCVVAKFVKEWKQCLRVQRWRFVLKSLSGTQCGAFLFNKTPVWHIWHQECLRCERFVFISFPLSISWMWPKTERYVTELYGDSSENELKMTKWQLELTTQPSHTLIHTYTLKHTVCSTDTAAISYHLSRLTAAAEETDGKRDGEQ